jgi:hypothetical protein
LLKSKAFPFLHNELRLSPALATINLSGVINKTLAVHPVPLEIFIWLLVPPAIYINLFAPYWDRIDSSTFLKVISNASTYFLEEYYGVLFKIFTNI